MINKLNEHKQTGMSLNITFIMAAILFVIDMFPLISNFHEFSYGYIINFTYTALKSIIILTPSIIFEMKKKSFVAHLNLFAFYLNPYILLLFNMTGFNTLFDYISFVLGVIMAIYSLIKLYAHKDEFNRINEPSRNIDIVIMISVIKVFLDQGFNVMAVYILLFITIVLSLRKSDALILSLSIYASSLVSNLYILFRNINSPSNIYMYIFLSIIINLFMIGFIMKIYNDNNNYNSYYN